MTTSSPIACMLYENPSMCTGPHMRHIANDIVVLHKSKPRSARRIASTIMDNSKSKNTHLFNAAAIMANADGDNETDMVFRHRLEKYEILPENDAGEIPDDLDLLQDNTALAAFIRAALDMKTDEIDINDLTDRLIQMPYEERNVAARGAINGLGGKHIKPYHLPVGCELE